MKEIIEGDYTFLIGNSVKDNVELLNKYGHTDFIWLHLKSYPSSHVVILHNNPEEHIIVSAAHACRESTKYRNIRNLKVSYTKYNNVQKTKIEGAVSFKSNRKLFEIRLN